MGISKNGKCSLCGGPYNNYGHNPEPLLKYEQRCCEFCNEWRVIPTRLLRIIRRDKENSEKST